MRSARIGRGGGSTTAREDPAVYEEVPHGGHYTLAGLAEISAYAAARMVTIVPEIQPRPRRPKRRPRRPWLPPPRPRPRRTDTCGSPRTCAAWTQPEWGTGRSMARTPGRRAAPGSGAIAQVTRWPVSPPTWTK